MSPSEMILRAKRSSAPIDRSAQRRPGGSSINHDLSPCKNGRVVGSQIQNRLRDFIGLAVSAEWDALANTLLQLFLCVIRGHDKGPDRCSSGARCNLIYPDFAGSEFRSQIAGHSTYAAFCGRIGSESRYPEHSLNRTIQYDRCAFIQMRRRGLNSEENARQIGTNDSFELLERGLADRSNFVEAGIGEYDIEITELFRDSIHGAFSRFDIGSIGLQSENVLAELV